jgi:hypothetical protein
MAAMAAAVRAMEVMRQFGPAFSDCKLVASWGRHRSE